ncbi:transglycosylase SLT domain-containing protein [Flavobacterium capsici]|uniref:Transglycosylase SLT domain-containing protein n=1 Tax=Flavobacterium capsici TaxID=3075618 RepID=A0AA96EW52_9FLAO|nr:MULTISPECIES: transglycosylase SLT domain-containing protein [unclassified Flavobacterium]WNM19281.1 transglycosylase SLT domain-containing protein [Flavobacterium sp. PMR2A8]WNM20670.1 transglycosylase SLT domain-containing protein [Flavobacterium sp. PMTSA4]
MSLIYENKVPSSYRIPFIAKVKEIATKLGINPNWLMAIMHWESAGTFSPSITNSIGATGLIQFMPSTAIGLGTTTTALRNMTAVQQLDYVLKYYLPYKSKITNYVDCYLVTFFPAAVGKDENYIIQTSKLPASLIATQNPAFDINKDKKVTVGEIATVMLRKLPTEWIKEFVKKKQ